MDSFTYHQKTKHSYESIRMYPNRLDWNNQPSVYKNYPKKFPRINFDYNINSHKFIFMICGITAKKSYPGVEYYLRVNPSAGALYPNELYFQAKNVEGFDDGIYHFEVSSSSFVKLVEIVDSSIEQYLGKNSIDGFVFLISSPYYRSSWKYKDRAFRYCLLDSGHILGALEVSAYLNNYEYEIIYDFDKMSLNNMFGFEDREFFLSSVIVGNETSNSANKIEFQLDFVDSTFFYEKNLLVESAYKNSLNINSKKSLEESAIFDYKKEYLEEVVLKRRSIRDFDKKAISKLEFQRVMEIINKPIKSDCDEEIEVYAILNRVQGMPLGVYKNGKYIKEGDFKNQAGYLCLEQALGKDSAVTFFLITNSENYQAVYQKAGILGHRLYIASNYLGIGCSGIGAYYDDETLEFFEVDYNSKVLYALAIGN